MLLGAAFVGVAAAPAAAAPACRPSITVLPLPAGAVTGSVTAAVPGLAVGTVLTARRVNRAVEWKYAHGQWVLRQIPGVPSLGATTHTFATGVNRHGAITIQAVPPGPSSVHSYVAADGTLTELLDGVGGHEATAEDISDTGRVVGSAYSSPEGVRVPVRWDYWDQAPRSLGLAPSAYPSTAHAVDVNDDIAGVVQLGPTLGAAAFRVDGDGAEQALDRGPGPAGSNLVAMAQDLNSSERTVGYASTASAFGAAVWDHGALTILPPFPLTPYAGGNATAVSEAGTVVGYQDTRAGSESPLVSHVLFWSDAGGLRSLLPASGRWADDARATAVTDDGSVYGRSVARAGTPALPTVWRCAAAQAFVPSASSSSSD